MTMTQIPDSDWIVAGPDGAMAALIKKAMRAQPKILNDFSEDEKRKAYGFALRLVIDGDDGGIFLLCFTKDGLQPKPPEIPIRNTVFTDEDTLLKLATLKLSDLDVIIPGGKELFGLDAFVWCIDNGHQDKLPHLETLTTIIDACAEGKIKFGGGEVPKLDMIKWQEVYEKALNNYALPIVRDMMVRAARTKEK